MLRNALALLAYLSFSSQPAIAQTQWSPTRNVELLTGTAAGGALDRTARLLQRIIQEKRLTETPVTVVNKVGGGGAVSWAYMNQKPGDGHFLSVTSVLLMTNRITGANPLSYTDITPIVQLMSEYQAIAVAADSPIASGKDLLDRLRADPASVRFGLGTSLGGSSHIAICSVAKAAGIDPRKLRFVIFKSGGESTTALLGGHVDAVGSNPANFARHVESGRLRSVGVAAPRRLGGAFAGVPTWTEQGNRTVVTNWRGIAGPKGLSPQQIVYWESVFAKAVEADEWKRDVEQNLAVAEFMRHREAMAFLESNYKELHAILAELGLAK